MQEGLRNICVIDFSSWIAGPYVSKLLADAGADIIKVETSSGDPMRIDLLPNSLFRQKRVLLPSVVHHMAGG